MSDIGPTSLSRTSAFWLLLLLPLLGACAGIGAVSQQKVEGVRTIGIISALPDEFHVQEIGLTVFGNDLKRFPIGSWGMDDYVTGKVRALLGKRYDVRPVTYQRAAVASAADAWGSLGEKIRPYISTQGLDAYLVLRGGVSNYLNTNQTLGGFGIVQHMSLHYFVFALYDVKFVDGRDFSMPGGSRGYMPGYEPPLSGPIHGAHQKVDQSWWPTSLDAGSNPRLKTTVTGLVDQSLPVALRRMQIIE